MKDKIKLLVKELTSINGVSGNEQNVLDYIEIQIQDNVDELKRDNFGNLIAVVKGKGSGKKIMIDAHADEVGFCVKYIKENGFIYFNKIGSASNKVMEGRKIWINQDIPGVIGIKPGHLMSLEERFEVKEVRDCFVDIGASSREEVEALGIEIGSPIAYQGQYMEMANKDLICSKAVDDRINCAVLIEVLRQIDKKSLQNDFYVVFSVQEETSMKGARIAVSNIEPDIAIAIDTIPSGDTPDVDFEKDLPVKLGSGPVCVLSDGTPNTNDKNFMPAKLKNLIKEAAQKADIKMQTVSLMDNYYLTNSNMLSVGGKGSLSGTIAIPRRYSHSPIELTNINDALDLVKLIKELIKM